MKAIQEVVRDVRPHWVGNGFPVRSLFSYHPDPAAVSPFLLLDYAGPHTFAPTEVVRGVGEHPHRGFETVTIIYQGELEHRDSAGNRGRIGPGDVQWMTAASGVVHEEYHSPTFTETGGTLEMVQLWVNLPAAEKMSPPRYQEILDSAISKVEVSDGNGTVRVIAGEFRGTRGPARTVTPIDVWDVRLNSGASADLPVAEGRTTLLVVQQGTVRLNETQDATGVELVRFDRTGSGVPVEAIEDAMLLVLSGEPIDEPVVGQGPFVMNSRDEIRQAMLDYQSGHMGTLGSQT
ncbi:MAG: pirin family protein [Planctomycetaceae bacterium]